MTQSILNILTVVWWGWLFVCAYQDNDKRRIPNLTILIGLAAGFAFKVIAHTQGVSATSIGFDLIVVFFAFILGFLLVIVNVWGGADGKFIAVAMIMYPDLQLLGIMFASIAIGCTWAVIKANGKDQSKWRQFIKTGRLAESLKGQPLVTYMAIGFTAWVLMGHLLV